MGNHRRANRQFEPRMHINKKGDRKRFIWQKADGLCAHCGRAVNDSLRTIDHIVPKSAGGGNDVRNLMPLCYDCNQKRSSNSIEPASFYKFASQLALDEYEDYLLEWRMEHSNAYGELVTKRK